MPRRRELKGIIKDLSESFNSRNFDHMGYWATGQICLSAQELGTDKISFDILNITVSPNNNSLVKICHTLHDHMNRILAGYKFPTSWLSEAKLDLSFNQKANKKYHRWKSTLGDPYLFVLKLVTDLGCNWEVTMGGYCLPHNPEREQHRNDF